ncbi:Formylglycine-generating enzyme [Burkholderiales bacterium]|nr:MAG: formylglycine-generating enzyme family protein [Burkholderiales bacterium]CAG1001223.1 Formylglycine-generating enzyme [Burkholderiales bacterium]
MKALSFSLSALATLALGAAPALAADPPAVPKLEFVRVPGGCFQMGSDAGEKHERPVHKACVGDFELGKYEVTQGQWKAVMGTNPAYHASCGDDCPVEMVSWNDAQEFITALNSRKIGVIRLPTEAEWEYACRDGGKDQVYAGKGDASSLDRLAWFKARDIKITHPVGRKEPNALGLYDMSGNVWEWVQDTFASPYRTSACCAVAPSTAAKTTCAAPFAIAMMRRVRIGALDCGWCAKSPSPESSNRGR